MPVYTYVNNAVTKYIKIMLYAGWIKTFDRAHNSFRCRPHLEKYIKKRPDETAIKMTALSPDRHSIISMEFYNL